MALPIFVDDYGNFTLESEEESILKYFKKFELEKKKKKKKKAARLAKIQNKFQQGGLWWYEEIKADGVIPTAQSSVMRKPPNWWQDWYSSSAWYRFPSKKKTLRTFRTGSCHTFWRRSKSRLKREENRKSNKPGFYKIEILEWYYSE